MPRLIEKWYPFIFGIFVVGFCVYQEIINKNIPRFPELVSSCINMSSIIIGFLATMISILITSVDKSVMQKIRKSNAIDLLTNYVSVAVISGLLVVVYSVGYSTVIERSESLYWYAFLGWVFVVALFLAATFRIMHVMLKILTCIAKENDQEEVANVIGSEKFNINIGNEDDKAIKQKPLM